MTALTWLFFALSFGAGFYVAWCIQRSKYEKILKILGNKIRAINSGTPS